MDIEADWNEFWKPLLVKNGKLDLEQVKRELYDYHVMMREVAKVYDTLTNGRISKPNTSADAVLSEVESLTQEEIRAETGKLRKALKPFYDAVNTDQDVQWKPAQFRRYLMRAFRAYKNG